MFVIAVAAEIFGNKTNFELSFPSRPTQSELTRAAETAFSNEISLRRPSESIPQHSFHVAKFKLYNEDRNDWVDLTSESMLVDSCQLYAFQPSNPWHKESQKEIPPAVRPPTTSARFNAQPTPRQQPLSTSTSYPNPNSSQQPSYAARPSAITPRVNVNASEDEKLRIVFSEFDLKGNRMIDMEDLKQGFRTLGLEFTTATMNDLFQKGDTNHDGRISFSEFERFAKFYPIMMDCLFYRSKAFWDEENLNRELQGERDAVRQAQNAVLQAQQALQNAQRAVEDANESIGASESDMKDRNGRIRDIAKDLDQAHRDKDRMQKDRFDRESELTELRDRERSARQNHGELAREAEKADRRAAGLQQEALKADDRVKQLQQQLLEAQRAADRANQAAKQAANDVDGVRQKEKDAQRQAENIIRELPRVEEGLREADFNINNALNRIKELEALSRELGRELDEASRRRDAGERAAQNARDQEAGAATDLERARRLAEERDRQAKAREAELLEQQRQRQLITQHERALIEQELRLREQRESLEEKETRLNSEAKNFLGNLRQSMAARSFSRDPSY